jgi:hypothetical protein
MTSPLHRDGSMGNSCHLIAPVATRDWVCPAGVNGQFRGRRGHAPTVVSSSKTGVRAPRRRRHTMKAHISSTAQGSQVRKQLVMAACGAALVLAAVAGLRAWQVAGRDGSTAVPAASQQAAPATADGHTGAIIGRTAGTERCRDRVRAGRGWHRARLDPGPAAAPRPAGHNRVRPAATVAAGEPTDGQQQQCDRRRG